MHQPDAAVAKSYLKHSELKMAGDTSLAPCLNPEGLEPYGSGGSKDLKSLLSATLKLASSPRKVLSSFWYGVQPCMHS